MSYEIKKPLITAPLMAEKLKELLVSSESFDDTIEELVRKPDDNQRVLFLEELLKKHDFMPKFNEWKLEKNPLTSKLYRDKGNTLFNEEKYMDATLSYNSR